MFQISESENLNFETSYENEIYHNMIGIFEQLKKKKIKLKIFEDNRAELEDTRSEFEISLGIAKEAVSPKTKLEIVLSKIIFNSPDKEFEKHIKSMSPKTDPIQHKLLLKNLTTIYNILESRRLESCYGDIYKGAKDRFEDARHYYFSNQFQKNAIPNDPIEALRFARYDQTDLVLNSEFKVAIDYINGVELTGRKGAYDLALMYWEKVVQKFLFEEREKIEESNMEDINSDQVQNQKSKDGTEESKTNSEQNDDESVKTSEDIINEKIENEINAKIKQVDEKIKWKKIKDTGKHKLLSNFKNPFEIDSNNNSSFAETCERLKKTGNKEILTVERELEKISKKQSIQKYSWKNIQGRITVGTHDHTELIEFNKTTSRKLKNTFKKIRGGKIGEVDSTGEDIDVDAYIDFKINKVGNFLVSSKNFVGFDIILAIDESSSMSKNMDTVKRMCATLYDAISDLSHVRLTIIGWNGTGDECFIKKITKPTQIGSLEGFGETPLATAVWYAKHEIEKMTSQKRLFFLITDGHPTKYQDIAVARKGIKLMSHNGIICNGIYVGDNYQRDISLMKEMFVDDFVICKNFNYVDTYLMDKISKQIIRSIKKANYN
jgi:hypothetical protein